MFTWRHIVLFFPNRAHVGWNWPFSGQKKAKNKLVCKIAVALVIMGAAGS